MPLVPHNPTLPNPSSLALNLNCLPLYQHLTEHHLTLHFKWDPASAARKMTLSPSKPQTQYLLQDCSHHPIPWKSGHSRGRHHTALTKEQRPEREAMKRWAQQERENAATCTSLGKSQLFLQREKDIDILRYYGYAM